MSDNIIRKADTGQAGNPGEFGDHTRSEPNIVLPPQPEFAEPLSQNVQPDYVDGIAFFAGDDERPVGENCYIRLSDVDGFRDNERVFYADQSIYFETRRDFTNRAPAGLTPEEKQQWCSDHFRRQSADADVADDGVNDWSARWYGIHSRVDAGLSPKAALEFIRGSGIVERVRAGVGNADLFDRK